ncbi:terpene synthase family protein [Polyangium aurulentum]|uniref:terpene synthase family protein n=1 Tax=Polyangium aurulentum TaxID=2567896 RepID=UPI0010AE6434|nr:terpene synthase [Polyangium aurulentum]UQA59810.1 hypothetical protein E8A73_004725 [Polyangium aurulentum]
MLTEQSRERQRRRLEYSRLAGMVHPDSPLEALQVAADWFTWLSLNDDVCDESKLGQEPMRMARMHGRYLEVLQGAATTSADDPFTHGLHDIRCRILRYGTFDTLQSFTYRVEQYFLGNRWEAGNRQRELVPSLSLFQAMRTYCGGSLTCFELLPITDGIDLPVDARNHTVVRQMAEVAGKVISYCNDLFSLEKERRHGDVHNLVLVIRHADQTSWHEALQKAIEIHNALVNEFSELRESLPSLGERADAELARYADCLSRWMQGNLEFSRTAQRFASLPE